MGDRKIFFAGTVPRIVPAICFFEIREKGYDDC